MTSRWGNRKQERRRRLAAWTAVVVASAAGAAASWSLIPGLGVALAIAIIAAGGLAGHRLMIGPRGVPILTYHSISPDPQWLPWSKQTSVHPQTFERQLATLATMGIEVIGTRALLAAGGNERHRSTAVLHFDDGYLDNWLFAVPALRAHNMAATFFASLDFIAPGEAVRSRGADLAGYMTWAELRAIEALPGLEVEPHGIDHGRVPISPKVVGTLDRDNWRGLAWVQWAATPGPKHDWFRPAEPIAAPLGTLVFESDGTLAARAWAGGSREPAAAYYQRVQTHLDRCVSAFEDRLGRRPQVFCWPENRSSADARRIAAETGYRATTGGAGRNAPGEPTDWLSRIHVGDRALGFRWGPAEALNLRATVRLFEGNHYWYLVVAPMDLCRKLVMRIRDRFAAPYC